MPDQPVATTFTDGEITLGLIGIMLVAGAIGGVVSTALSRKDSTEKDGTKTDGMGWNLCIGIGAACLVPVFLQVVSSEILTNLYKEGVKTRWALIFFAYCVLAGISSRRFIQVVTDKAIDLGEKVKGLQKKVEETEQKNKSLQQTTQALGDSIQHNLIPLPAPQEGQRPVAVPAVPQGLDSAVANRVLDNDDPWKGQFGGEPAGGGRRVDAEITPMSGREGWCIVTLMVVSTDPAKPLEKPVVFMLHPPTFKNYSPKVVPVNGLARLSIMTWGAFTVGVLCDDGKIKLELDLSQHPAAQEPWKSR
jgi:hypothetical protein